MNRVLNDHLEILIFSPTFYEVSLCSKLVHCDAIAQRGYLSICQPSKRNARSACQIRDCKTTRTTRTTRGDAIALYRRGICAITGQTGSNNIGNNCASYRIRTIIGYRQCIGRCGSKSERISRLIDLAVYARGVGFRNGKVCIERPRRYNPRSR